jgi:hypothetical protein
MTYMSTPGTCLVPSWCPAWVCPGAASFERCLCLVDLYSCYLTSCRVVAVKYGLLLHFSVVIHFGLSESFFQ